MGKVTLMPKNMILSYVSMVIEWALMTSCPTVYPADVPQGSSDVYIQGTQLLVSRRNPDGSLDMPRPYVIHGVTWSLATRAPAEGPNPLDPTKTVPYGFFFDWLGRTPQGSVVFAHWLRS